MCTTTVVPNLKYWEGDDAHLEVTTAGEQAILTSGAATSWFGVTEALEGSVVVIMPLAGEKGVVAGVSKHFGPQFHFRRTFHCNGSAGVGPLVEIGFVFWCPEHALPCD